MKVQLVLLLSICTLLYTCTGQPEPAEEVTETPPTTDSITVDTQCIAGILVYNARDYAPLFLEQLGDISKMFPIAEVKDGQLITADGDQMALPEAPKKDELVVLSGTNDSHNVKLRLERANRTSINYELTYGPEGEHRIKGRVHLSTVFILGMESDEDDQSGEYYFSYDYCEDNKQADLCIRLADVAPNEPLRAKVKIRSKAKDLPGIDLDSCPTLRVSK